MGVVLGLPRGADGFYILELLGLAGWDVAVTAGRCGGSLVRATRAGRPPVEREGPTVADVALGVFEEARELDRVGA